MLERLANCYRERLDDEGLTDDAREALVAAVVAEVASIAARLEVPRLLETVLLTMPEDAVPLLWRWRPAPATELRYGAVTLWAPTDATETMGAIEPPARWGGFAWTPSAHLAGRNGRILSWALRAASPRFAALSAWVAVRFVLDDDPDGIGAVYGRTVRAALDAVAKEGDDLAAGARARDDVRDRFARDLRRTAREIVGTFAGDPLDGDAAPTETSAGAVLAWDAAFAVELEGIGAEGLAAADETRKHAAGRWMASEARLLPGGAPDLWRLWQGLDDRPERPRWLATLARVLWCDRWRASYALELSKHAPAMPLLLRRHLADLRHGDEVRTDGDGTHYIAADGTIVGRFVAPALSRDQLERMRAGVAHLRGVTFERVIRGLALKAFTLAADGARLYNLAVYLGGFEAFAKEHGINSKDRARLPEIFEAIKAYRGGDRDIPPIIADYWVQPSKPGRPAELRVTIGEALLPMFVSSLRPSRKDDRWLLPVLPVPELAFVGGTQQWRMIDLQWDILTELRARAEEYAQHGGVYLSRDDERRLAGGLRLDIVRLAIDRWTTGDGAWLTRTAAGRLRLADEGPDALIRDAALVVETAKKGGRTRAAIARGERPKRGRRGRRGAEDAG